MLTCVLNYASCAISLGVLDWGVFGLANFLLGVFVAGTSSCGVGFTPYTF